MGSVGTLAPEHEETSWSKTVMGYGPEGQGFVTLELIYHTPSRRDLREMVANPPAKLCKAPRRQWVQVEVRSAATYHRVRRELAKGGDDAQCLVNCSGGWRGEGGGGGDAGEMRGEAAGRVPGDKHEGAGGGDELVSVLDELSLEEERENPWVLLQVSHGLLVKVYGVDGPLARSVDTDGELTRDGRGGAGAGAGAGGGQEDNPASSRDPISQVEIPVPDLRRALQFWQFAIGLHCQDYADPACLCAGSSHLLRLREEPPPLAQAAGGSGGSRDGGEGGQGGVTARGAVVVKVGLMVPESWLPGMTETATQDFGCRQLTPLLAVDTPGKGSVKLVEVEGPGGCVVRLMSEEDMQLLASVCDESAAAHLEQELAVDDTPQRLREEEARMEAEALLRSAGRKVPGEEVAAAAARTAEAAASANETEVVTEVLRMEPLEDQLAKLIWLHGGGLHSLVRTDHANDMPDGWASLASAIDMPWCKLLVPEAQVRKLKFGGDVLRPSWFDLDMDGLMHDASPVRVGSENVAQLGQSARVIADLVAEEKELCTDPVVLGGFGPGAAVALWALLSVKHSGPRPDALILCNCWAPPGLMRPKNMEALKGLPVLVLIAARDPVVPVRLQTKLADTLRRLGFNVTVHQYPAVSHSLNLGEQGPAIREFMLRLARQGCSRERAQEIDEKRRVASETLQQRAAEARDGFEQAFGVPFRGPNEAAEGEEAFAGMQEVPVVTELVNITFNLKKSSHFLGQKVFVSGSCETLGTWDRSKMVQLSTSEETFPTWSVTVPLPVFSKTSYQYFVVNPIASGEDGAEEPVAETTGALDSLFALGDLRQMGDSEDASASVQEVRPERLVPPPAPDPATVHEIVRSVAVHRRPLVVRDTFGTELLKVAAAHSEMRPVR